MSRKKLNIGLFGLGCVGYGLYQVLTQTPSLNAEIVRVGVKDRNKARSIDTELLSFDAADLLDDPQINVIVELIDDSEAAFRIVAEAMKKGKHVVSANKKMLAEHFSELRALQLEYNVAFLYEAACCASIPVIRNLEEYYDNDLLESISGIVNGSTNYILSQAVDKGLSYEKALAQAQELGYAESNPSLDVEGYDAQSKLLILLIHGFGVISDSSEVFRLGINRLNELDFQYAREKGLKIKLVAHAAKNKQGFVSAFVIPTLVKPEHPLYSVSDVYNGICIQSGLSETQFFSGKGAGAFPTASAVLSDLSALSYDYRYEYRKLDQELVAAPLHSQFVKVYVRFKVQLQTVHQNYFYQIHEQYSNAREVYVIGTINLKRLDELISIDSQLSAILIEPVFDLDEIQDSFWDQLVLMGSELGSLAK